MLPYAEKEKENVPTISAICINVIPKLMVTFLDALYTGLAAVL